MTHPAHARARQTVARRVAAVLAALLALAAAAGALPGSTILLGLLSSDARLDVARVVGAVALLTVAAGRARSPAAVLGAVGAIALVVGVAMLMDPDAGVVLGSVSAVLEGCVTLAFGATALATARVCTHPRARAARAR